MMEMKNTVLSRLFAFQRCLICKSAFAGVVCEYCKSNFVVRSGLFCCQCGIRLLSEIQFCTACRESIDAKDKSNDVVHDCFVYSLWSYTEEVRKLIYEYKHNTFRALRYFFCSELYRYIVTHVLSHTMNDVAIVPIPANPKKVLKRGFDQSKVLAKMLARATKSKYISLFHRKRKAKEQKNLNAKERNENMKQALQIKNTQKCSTVAMHNTIILLDDIVTTGTTMQTAFRVLYKACMEQREQTQSSHSYTMKNNPTIIGLSLARID